MPTKKNEPQDEPKSVVATMTGSVTHPDDGTLVTLVEGQTELSEDDPVVAAFPEFFADGDDSDEKQGA